MNAKELQQGIGKALEIWSIQSVCDIAIMLTFVILVLVAGRSYLDSIRNRLTLRVTAEAWDTGTDFVIDLMLGFVALVGLFVINPDIMDDIKIALPFVPIGMVLSAAALVVRVWHGGRNPGSTAWWVVLVLLGVACAANWFGFTFIMEADDDWTLLRNLRSDIHSDINPPLALITFYVANPALVLIMAWGVIVGAARSCSCNSKNKAAPVAPLVSANEK